MIGFERQISGVERSAHSGQPYHSLLLVYSILFYVTTVSMFFSQVKHFRFFTSRSHELCSLFKTRHFFFRSHFVCLLFAFFLRRKCFRTTSSGWSGFDFGFYHRIENEMATMLFLFFLFSDQVLK